MDYLRDINIFVVDGIDFTASLQRQMLRVLGARNIRVYTRSDKAWSDFKRTPADIILTGWRIRPFSGLAFVDKLRNDGETPNPYVPIIMVTGYSDEEHVGIARDAGVNEYVIKPFSPKSLFSRIEAVIDRPRRFVRVPDFFGPDRRRTTKPFTGPERREENLPTPEENAAEAPETDDSAAAD